MSVRPTLPAALTLLLLCGCSIPGTISENGPQGQTPNNGGGTAPAGNPLAFANPKFTSLLAGSSQSPTHFAAFSLAPNFSLATVRGYRNGLNQGHVVVLPQSASSANGVVLSANGLGNVPNMTDPFALERLNTSDLLVTDQVTTNANGRLVLVSDINPVTGLATHTQLGSPTLRTPIDVTTSGAVTAIWVAEYRASNDGGCVRFYNTGNNSMDIFANGLSFPSSVLYVRDGARNFLYIAENGTGAVSGVDGGILRLDLATFVSGSTVAVGQPGVTVISPRAGDPSYSHPFDLALDSGYGGGDVVATEGLSINLGNGLISQNGTGRIRAIPGVGRSEPDRSRLIQNNLLAPRGPWMTRYRDNNQIYTTFAEGLGSSCTVRSASFDFSSSVSSFLDVLASGQSDVLDTAVDLVTPSLRFTVNYNGSNAGQVVDLRNGP